MQRWEICTTKTLVWIAVLSNRTRRICRVELCERLHVLQRLVIDPERPNQLQLS